MSEISPVSTNGDNITVSVSPPPAVTVNGLKEDESIAKVHQSKPKRFMRNIKAPKLKSDKCQIRNYVFQPSSDASTSKDDQGVVTQQPKSKKPLAAWIEKKENKLRKKYRSRNVAHWMECSKKKVPPPLLNISLDAALVEAAMDTLQEGTTLYKVKSFSSWYRRRYVFEKENKRIVYEGSRKLPCLKATEIIDIQDIHDIRKGWKTDRFNKIAFKVARAKQKKPNDPNLVDETCCFSVIYGPDHVTLDLICPSETVCNDWVRGLSHLIALQRSIERDQALNSWLKDQFRKADIDKSGGLNFDECMVLVHQLNIDMDKQHTKLLFDEANNNKMMRNEEDVIDEQEFVTFYMLLKKRPELEELFNKYSAGANVWGPNNLIAFLEKEQKMSNMTIDDACDLIEIYEPTQHKEDGFMSLDGFRRMLQSDLMDVRNINHRVVYQDMKQPLSHYFIASSHNTYLMADQLAGESSVEGYIRAFESGCRCVELDLWDGPDNEPIVYHGYTLTSKILLKDILVDAIKPYAFARSEYPVILSLENHLGIDQQKVLANHLKTILGEFLYMSSVSPDMTMLPPPSYLKKKIIVKNKKLSDHLDVSRNEEEESISDREDETVVPEGVEKPKHDHRKAKIAPELSDLVNLCQAVHFTSFDRSREEGKVCYISSLSEGKALQLAEDQPVEFIAHNQKQLTRIYPAGFRQDSSNYDPAPLWNVGCQIVSLNYQTRDEYMMLNECKFEDNGKCGYVLKPEFLRTGEHHLDYRLNREPKVKKTLTMKQMHMSDDQTHLIDKYPSNSLCIVSAIGRLVINGQCIPKPHQATYGEIIDPYVVVSILGGHTDDQKQFKTKYVHNNGFNPMWNETFVIELIQPETAFVHFIVKDYSAIGRDEKLGEYCLPFTSVEQGYRHVHLRDEYYRPMVQASLFVHVTIDTVE